MKDRIFIGDRYEVLSKIGAGGMADVYKGKDHKPVSYTHLDVYKRQKKSRSCFVSTGEAMRDSFPAVPAVMWQNVRIVMWRCRLINIDNLSVIIADMKSPFMRDARNAVRNISEVSVQEHNRLKNW